MASKADLEAGRAFVRLFLKNDFSRQLVRALKNAQVKLRKFGQSALMTGRQIAVIGAAMAAPFVFATRTFAEFDDAMLSVATKSGAAADEMERLTEQAKLLGRTTSFTAIQVAEAMVNLAKSGFAADEIDKSIPSVLNLARATGIDLAEAADTAAITLRQFKLDASEMNRVADVMTATVNSSTQGMGDLAESMKFGALIATEYGLSLEEVSKTLGILANAGLRGTMGGTALRKIMLELANPSVQKRLEGMIGPIIELGELKTPSEILQRLGKHMDNVAMTGPQKISLIRDLFQIRAVGAGAKLTSEDLTSLSDAIDNAAGSAAKSAETMDSGLGGALRILKSAIEGVKIEIGGALAPALQKLAKFMTTTLQSAIEWIKANRGMVVVAAIVAAGVIALGGALTGVGIAALAASFALGGLATIVSIITSPLGLITIAVVGATLAFFRWTEAGQSAFRSLSSTLGKMLERFRVVFGGIGDAISSGDFALAFDIMKAAARLAFAEVAARAKFVFMTLIPGLASSVFQGLAGGFAAVIDGWRRPLEAYFGLMKAQIVTVFNFWVANTKSQFQLAGDLARVLWDNFSELAQVSVQNSLAFLIEGLIKVGEFIRTTIGGAFLDAVEGFVRFAQTASKSVAIMVINALKGFFAPGIGVPELREAGESVLERVSEEDQKLADAAIAGIAGQFADSDAVLTAMAEQMAEAIRNHAERIAAAGKDAAATFAPAALEFEAAISELSGDVRDSFMERFTEAFEGVADFKDPAAVTALRERLAELIAEAAKAKGAAVGGEAGGGAGAGAGAGVAAALAAPRGVALTATHLSAAARISGFQPDGPEKRMAAGIDRIAVTSEKQLQALEQFLAGWRVA